ncbi:MAG: hypothetical protein C0506_13040 [Anaerolinea sp.]|nr:hypothetical protein [Anaerolinea sp.]
MTFLVDSDRVIDYLKGQPDAVVLLQGLATDGVAISIVTFGEVYEGIYYGRDPAHYEAVFRSFLSSTQVLGVSRTVARRFAVISGQLRLRGLPTPASDLWIAATALAHDLTLVTGNLRHFDRVPGLRIHPQSKP